MVNIKVDEVVMILKKNKLSKCFLKNEFLVIEQEMKEDKLAEQRAMEQAHKEAEELLKKEQEKLEEEERLLKEEQERLEREEAEKEARVKRLQEVSTNLTKKPYLRTKFN